VELFPPPRAMCFEKCWVILRKRDIPFDNPPDID